jgi:Xaa-Pro aminopeptidase
VTTAEAVFGERVRRVRHRMAELGVDVVLLSVGADLPWLCGYEAMPLERLTMLVVPADGDVTLVVPALEAPRVVDRPGVLRLRAWGETEDPAGIVAALVGARRSIAIGDRTWSRFLLELQIALPGRRWERAAEVVGPLRAVKDAHEVEALARAAGAADTVATALRAGEIPLVGRSEAEVSAELGRRLVAEGHHRVNFAIVAAGESAASPHHDPGSRRIGPGEVVLCDFGGTMLDDLGVGYCSDITRCVWTGPPPAEALEVYSVLQDAQAAAVRAATVGTPCAEVDRAARSRIDAAGLGAWFVHRTGHGIGVEEHEDPYVVEGNAQPLVAGHAFSVEPGIYLPGRFGFRLEDIVVAADDGPRALNTVDRALAVVDA